MLSMHHEEEEITRYNTLMGAFFGLFSLGRWVLGGVRAHLVVGGLGRLNYELYTWKAYIRCWRSGTLGMWVLYGFDTVRVLFFLVACWEVVGRR